MHNARVFKFLLGRPEFCIIRVRDILQFNVFQCRLLIMTISRQVHNGAMSKLRISRSWLGKKGI